MSFYLNRLSIEQLIKFKLVFLNIIIEALPFIFFSVLISALLHNFLSEEVVRKVLPKNKYLSIVLACCLGMIFPICDCGMVPIVRRLVLKKVPLCTAITFMLAAPVINPVAIAATAYAFRSNNDFAIIYLRLGLTFFIAITTGLLLNKLITQPQLRNTALFVGCDCNNTDPVVKRSLFKKVHKTLCDASKEFIEMGIYVLPGAFFGAIAQTVIAREFLLAIGHSMITSIVTMMVVAFAISGCSSAYVFIAASLSDSFTVGSLLAFMVFGPMLDFKNTMLLLHVFKARFVVLVIVIVAAVCASGAVFINQF